MGRRVEQPVGGHHAILTHAPRPIVTQARAAVETNKLDPGPPHDDETLCCLIPVTTMMVGQGERFPSVDCLCHLARAKFAGRDLFDVEILTLFLAMLFKT